MACGNDHFNCSDAYLGQFHLNLSQLARLNRYSDYRPNDDERDEIVKKTS